MSLIIDYIVALTNLYGLVHRGKVIEIYNMQNTEPINADDLENALNVNADLFNKNFVDVHGKYFVNEAITEFGDFELELMKREGKPFYIPEKNSLLKYSDNYYFERNKEYVALRTYLERNFFEDDPYKAEMVCEDIQGKCQHEFTISKVFETFNERDIVFESDEQVQKVFQLVMDIMNNVRLWRNNGFTPAELSGVASGARQTRAAVSEKVGRNEPCPCGSGKKYKKCCLGRG